MLGLYNLIRLTTVELSSDNCYSFV